MSTTPRLERKLMMVPLHQKQSIVPKDFLETVCHIQYAAHIKLFIIVCIIYRKSVVENHTSLPPYCKMEPWNDAQLETCLNLYRCVFNVTDHRQIIQFSQDI